MIDVRELDPVEMTGIVGGDERCGNGFSIPIWFGPVPTPWPYPLNAVYPGNIVLPVLAGVGANVVVH
jgi:hypothetical protein